MTSYRPALPVGAFVESIWWSRRDEPYDRIEHMLPTGRAQIVIALHDEPIAWRDPGETAWHAWTGGIVHGPQASYYLAGPKPRGAVVGASLVPGAARAVLGVPASELSGRHVTIDELWGARGRELRDRLSETQTAGEACALLERALMQRLRSPLLLHPAVARMLMAARSGPPFASVSDLQRASGYSHKHVVAVFREAVGLAPKQYLSLARFGAALRELAGDDRRSLADVAVEAGYADQPHMNRHFAALAGVAPGRYRPAAPASPHHHVRNVQENPLPMW